MEKMIRGVKSLFNGAFAMKFPIGLIFLSIAAFTLLGSFFVPNWQFLKRASAESTQNSSVQTASAEEDKTCRYIIPGPVIEAVDAKSPDFFNGVKKIFLYAGVGISARGSFDRNSVLALTACALKRHLNNYGSTGAIPMSIPIAVVDSGDGQPEASADGSLMIDVVVNVNDKLWLEKPPHQKLVNVQFLYFRSDKTAIAHFSPQCAVSFPFTADAEKRYMLLTYAAQHCLLKKYSLSEPIPEKK